MLLLLVRCTSKCDQKRKAGESLNFRNLKCRNWRENGRQACTAKEVGFSGDAFLISISYALFATGTARAKESLKRCSYPLTISTHNTSHSKGKQNEQNQQE